jgi:hypothetical protein
MASVPRSAWPETVEAQSGVVSRRQALACGWTSGQIQRHRRSGRWQLVHPGTYVTFTGPLPWTTLVWAALLHAGPDAVVSHRTAGHFQGLVDDQPMLIDVLVPWGRRVTPRPGVVLRSSRRLGRRKHPARSLPQTRVEETVLDLVEASTDVDEVVGWLTRGVQRRRTVPERLLAAVHERARLRHRSLVISILEECREGVASALESRSRHGVEMAHGLPRATRGERLVVAGRTWFADVRYGSFGTRVELEGLRWHPGEERWRDGVRDNAAVLHGDVVLRYDWRAVAGRPCETAREVAHVLRQRGWQGRARLCGPGCSAASA